MVWLGHSSYYIQLAGKRLLIDPVLSKSAAPITYINKVFEGTNIYTANDIPHIDYLLIPHDHWDHLDYPTIKALQNKVNHVITGLGVGECFEYWGYDPAVIHEADWNTEIKLGETLSIHLLPAQHYSSRLLTKNKTLWVAFALITANQKIFFSGDSGYGPHFVEIGKQFDGFDLVMLDSGQYDEQWRDVHMMPEEAIQHHTLCYFQIIKKHKFQSLFFSFKITN